MKIKHLILGLLSMSIMVHPYASYADEITVSGNGEDSSNNVSVSSDQNTNTEQNNDAQITNNVTLNANTGSNEANDNTGGTTNITTGDISASSQIINTGINQSSVEAGCCSNSTDIGVNGNGSDSNNQIAYSQNNNTNIGINNNANINNSVKGSANTGYNEANKNNGRVSIKTGDISATDLIKNNSINVYSVIGGAGNSGNVSLQIADNGASSENSVKLANNSNISISVDNNANITNDSHWDLNTGNNEANQNNGDVSISTGDILSQSTIENSDINGGLVDVDCCSQKNNPPPDSTPPQSNPPSSNNPGGGSDGTGGTSSPSVAGTTTQILPVTGDYTLLFFLIGNIAMLFLGGYLRLRSGRSPNYLFAK